MPKEWRETHSLRRRRETLLPLIPQSYSQWCQRNEEKLTLKEKKGETSALNSSEVYSQRCQRNEEKLTQRRKREALLPLIPQRYIHSNAKGMKRNSLFKEKKGDTSALNSSEVNSQRCQRNEEKLTQRRKRETLLPLIPQKENKPSSLAVWISSPTNYCP